MFVCLFVLPSSTKFPSCRASFLRLVEMNCFYDQMTEPLKYFKDKPVIVTLEEAKFHNCHQELITLLKISHLPTNEINITEVNLNYGIISQLLRNGSLHTLIENSLLPIFSFMPSLLSSKPSCPWRTEWHYLSCQVHLKNILR